MIDRYWTLRALRGTPLFDEKWYKSRYPDLRDSRIDAAEHYYEHGASERRRASSNFDTRRYLRLFPEVLESGQNPLIHFLRNFDKDPRVCHFESELYDPYNTYERLERSGTFDIDWYLSENPDVRESGADPLKHYIEFGYAEGRPAHPDDRLREQAYGIVNGDIPTPQLKPLEPTSKSYIYENYVEDSKINQEVLRLQTKILQDSHNSPLFSFIIPIYKVSSAIVQELIDSLMKQSYLNWEACIALAYLDDEALRQVVEVAQKSDPRIRVTIMSENKGISGNSNAALEMARGDFIVLVDHDDIISPNALFEFWKVLNVQPDVDFIYSDKDMITESGGRRFNPLFKPEWSPEIMLNANYLTHLNALRTSRVREVGGWDSSTDGAQDWDLFFRVIGQSGKVAHVPKVLYHWRLVATSVSAGGMAAKPYAAAAQLRAVKGGLNLLGWSDAIPEFADDGLIRINWQNDLSPESMLVFVGSTGLPSWAGTTGAKSSVFIEVGEDLAQRINDAIAASDASFIAIVPDLLQPITDYWLREILAPLCNSAIGATTGKLLGLDAQIQDAGWVAETGRLVPLFRGMKRAAYSDIGFANWYRNVAAISFATLSFSRDTWSKIGGLREGERPDFEFTQRIKSSGFRLLYNPFVESWIDYAHTVERYLFGEDANRETPSIEWNSCFNVNLIASGSHGINIRRLAESSKEHRYGAEAFYVAGRFDAKEKAEPALLISSKPKEVPTTTKGRSRSGPSKPLNLLFLVPNFSNPFYGGIMTILRFCDYVARKGEATIFIGVLGSSSEVAVSRTIAAAFPKLASVARIICVSDRTDVNELNIPVMDIGFCSLWTTAYLLRDLKKCNHKFYFMQDYEPLFYPAGTTSKIVEATYGFGFHGISNTPSLASLYQSHGGTADYFYPSVDRSVFYPNCNRTEVRSQSSVKTIFAYMRPGHPRNCFELLVAGFRDLKDAYGDEISIVTAGAPWSLRDYGLEGTVNHLGLLEYQETSTIYRSVDIGVVAMATPHPSYIPFELMACGTAVASTRNAGTDWFFQGGANGFLFDYNVASFVSVMSRAVDDAEERRSIANSGLKLIDSRFSDWDASCQSILDVVKRTLT